MPKVLLIDDDKQILDLLSEWLQHEQYVVETVDNGGDALFRLKSFSYDAIILDWELPDSSGIELCKSFRASGGSTPIIMLTGRDRTLDKIEGLDTGVDDYLCKPCNLDELSARLRAVLRRPTTVQSADITIGTLVIDLLSKTVTKAGAEIRLQPREFELLAFLAQHPKETFSAEALMARIWPSESESSPDVIRVHVAKIRSKLSNADVIKTLHGTGYRFDASALTSA